MLNKCTIFHDESFRVKFVPKCSGGKLYNFFITTMVWNLSDKCFLGERIFVATFSLFPFFFVIIIIAVLSDTI